MCAKKTVGGKTWGTVSKLLLTGLGSTDDRLNRGTIPFLGTTKAEEITSSRFSDWG